MKNTFYNIKNLSNNSLDIYVYGAIVSGGNDWKWDETDVTFVDFRDKLEGFSGDTINIYVNSPGGSVFTTDGIIAMLKREQAKGKTINAYIDGLAASAASFLITVADNIYVYSGSMMMIHRAIVGVYGNADDLYETIGFLEKIEEGSIIPAYMSKAKEGMTEEKFKEMMKEETWMTSKEIQEVFNVTLLEESKELVACVDKELFANYKNVPKSIEILNESTKTEMDEVEYRYSKEIEEAIMNTEIFLVLGK